MKKQVKLLLFLGIFSVVFGFTSFGRSAFAASVEIRNFNIRETEIPAGKASTLNYDIDLGASVDNIKKECESDDGDLDWSMVDVSLSQATEDYGDVLPGGRINGREFLGDQKYTHSSSFLYTIPSRNLTTAAFKLKVACHKTFFGGGEPITESAREIVNITGQQAGAASVKFSADKQNQSVQPGTDVKINFNLSVTADEAELRSTCNGDTLEWNIFMVKLSNVGDRSNSLASSGISFGTFRGGATIPQSIPLTVKAPNEDFGFFANVECDKKGLGSDVLTESSLVRVNAGGAAPGGPAPVFGPAAPGKTDTFIFKLDNPLEADNFVELIDVIATWLFNLSIPVVVVMIVYAGVMFLTSRGEPARVTKARQILLYAVVGFTIILVGKGFITLIESILNLGSTP